MKMKSVRRGQRYRHQGVAPAATTTKKERAWERGKRGAQGGAPIPEPVRAQTSASAPAHSTQRGRGAPPGDACKYAPARAARRTALPSPTRRAPTHDLRPTTSTGRGSYRAQRALRTDTETRGVVSTTDHRG